MKTSRNPKGIRSKLMMRAISSLLLSCFICLSVGADCFAAEKSAYTGQELSAYILDEIHIECVFQHNTVTRIELARAIYNSEYGHGTLGYGWGPEWEPPVDLDPSIDAENNYSPAVFAIMFGVLRVDEANRFNPNGFVYKGDVDLSKIRDIVKKPSWDFEEGTYDIWDGTTEAPTTMIKKDDAYYYQINKCSELAYVVQTGGNWLSYNYTLEKNLIINDVSSIDDYSEEILFWDTEYVAFSGKFDGNNYGIFGLNNHLFSGLDSGGVLKNTKVYKTMLGGSDILSGTQGGLFYSSAGTIERCEIHGVVLGGSQYVGGFVSELTGTIDSCKNYCNVRGSGYVGGIVGRNKGRVINCINYGTIESTTTKDSCYGGGVVGLSEGTIKGCENRGTFWGVFSAIGGIVSHNKGPLESSINYSDINSDDFSECSYGGGICGFMSKKITDCVNYGRVAGKQAAGGIAGCMPYGVSAVDITRCINTGCLDSDSVAGGILGIATNADNKPYIYECVNTGAINGIQYVGGLIGNTKRCYINNSYNTGIIKGTSYVGGIAGVLNESSLYNVYSNGMVDGNENIGGIAGTSDYIWGNTRLENVHYLSNDNYLAFNLIQGDDDLWKNTSQELKASSTYYGFDFQTTWDISSNDNGGYPFLRWQSALSTPVHVHSIEITESQSILYKGDIAYFEATVYPTNASNQSISWKSSNSKIATVNIDGMVTAKAPGTVTIYAISDDGDFMAFCEVEVRIRTADEYTINSISIRSLSGDLLTTIPNFQCWVTVSITHNAAVGNSAVLLATYDENGRYIDMMAMMVEDMPDGSTIKNSLMVDNSSGNVALIKAFPVSSLSDLTPLGSAIAFEK